MALQKARIPVLIRGGLAQNSDEVALGLGEGFVLQENLKYDRGGVLKKRHGYTAQSDTTFRALSTVDLANVRSLHSHRGALVAVLGLDPSQVASYTDGGWVEHGPSAPCSLRRSSALRIQILSAENVQCNVTSDWTVITYLIDNVLFYAQIDTATGAFVQPPRYLIPTHCRGHRAITLSGGDVLVVYYYDDGSSTQELRCFRLKPNLGSPSVTSSELLIEAAIVEGFDAVADPTENDTFYVAWNPRSDIKVEKFTIGALPLDAPVSVAGPLTHIEPNATGALCCDIYGNGDLWVSFSRFSAGTADVRLGRWTTSPFAAAGFSTVFSTASGGGFPRTVVGLDGWVGWEPPASSSDGGGFQQVTSAGATSGSRRYFWRGKIESRYFRHRSHDWIFARDTGADHYLLVRPDQGQESPATVTYHGAVCLDVAAGVGTYPLSDVPSVVTLGSNKFRWAATVHNGIASPAALLNDGANGADLIDLDFAQSQAPCVSSTEAADSLLWAGGCTPIFDGLQAVESGFVRAPILSTPTVTGGLGSIEGADISPGVYNVYIYRAHYERQDARGNWHLSETSVPFEVEVSLANNNARVEFDVAYLAFTRRGDSPLQDGRNARVAIFRTEKNSPNGPYYRITDPTTAIENQRGVNSTTFTDSYSDAQMLALGFGLIYTDGGKLDDQLPPPSLAVATWQNRCWLISGDDPRQILFSKEILPGEAPRWNRTLFVQIEEEATGLAVSGATLLIFSRSRIYALSGTGPADTGYLSDWRGPVVLNESVGCIDSRSIVDFPGGTVFQSELGFHLLASPQAPPQFIGGGVLQTVRDYPRCRGAAHDAANGRLLWTMARTNGQALTLVFDYLRSAWQVWTPGGTSSARYPGALCVHQGAHHYASGAALLKQTTSLDDDGEYFAWRLILPWARLQGIAGYQRLWHVSVTLKRGGGVNLLVRLRHDESTALAQETAFALSDMDAESGGRLVVDAHVVQQKGRSVQVELSEELPEDGTETGGLEIYGIDLEIGQKKGRYKAAQENRK